MKTKTCGECRFYAKASEHCKLKGVGWKFATDNPCSGFTPQAPLTNGDVIRQMSNEELATWGMYDLGTCPTFEKRQTCPKCGECSASEVEDCWLNWLNAPAESEGEDE